MATADLTRLASRLYAAVRAVRDQLDDQFKAALFASDGAASGAWGLALVLASWRRQKAGDSLSELADTGVGPLASQIQNFENAFPASFSKFLDAAEKATDAGRIAAAGSYFASTVRDLGFVVRPGLLSWLNSPGFTKVATALRGKLGGPADAAQTVAAVPTPTNRTRSFDQADFRAATRPAPSPPRVLDQQPVSVALTMQLPVVRDQQPPPVASTTPISATPAPIQVEPPRTSQRDMQLATLIAAGWSPEQAALILAGPGGKSQTPPNTKQADATRPVIDGKTILDRANTKDDRKPDNTASDVAAVTGVIKSGLDVLGEILKQINTGGSKGSGGGQNPGSSGGGGGGSMTGFGGGGSMTGFEGGGRMTEYDGGTPIGDYGSDMPSYGGPGAFGDGGTIFDINDSSEVID